MHAERTVDSGFKVTYTNINKAYVPKLSGADIYRSYLSLMPESDDDEEENTRKTSSVISEERLKILAHFQTLSGAQQEAQRKTWTDELSVVEKEIGELKLKLGAKVSRRNQLRFLLGMEMMRKVKIEVTKQARKSLNQIKDFINMEGLAIENNNSPEKEPTLPN